MVASLIKEDSNSGTSCLEQLAELVHCMVFRFPGFPDLYEPVMEAIKVSSSPCFVPCPVLTQVSIRVFLWAWQQLPVTWSVSVDPCLPQAIPCFRHTIPPARPLECHPLS